MQRERLPLAGLSPLARGTPISVSRRICDCRFIPAGAGNTPLRFCRVSVISVYPRWRGEHPIKILQGKCDLGLSPLARGTPTQTLADKEVIRFIPAGAGNTVVDGVKLNHSSVYPRWRGEHSKHNLLLINDFLSQSQSTNFIVSYKQHIHYVKEHLIH